MCGLSLDIQQHLPPYLFAAPAMPPTPPAASRGPGRGEDLGELSPMLLRRSEVIPNCNSDGLFPRGPSRHSRKRPENG